MAGGSEKKDDQDQKDKQVKKKPALPPKRYWHVYSLQSLQAEKLTKIVNKVLQREFILIK